MKLRNLIIPTFLLLGLCSCDFKIKSISGIDVSIDQKTRKTGEKFDMSDIHACLIYDDETTKDVEFKYFSTNNLYVRAVNPYGDVKETVINDFTLDIAGTYSLEVHYKSTARYAFDIYGQDSFEVEKTIIKATSLTLAEDSLCLKEGDKAEISYAILPENVTMDTPTFESNDTSIATVNSKGVITALKEGQCIISVQADDIKKECLITVVPSSIRQYNFDSNKFTSSSGDWNYSIEGSSFDFKQNRGVCIENETTLTSKQELAGISEISYECFTGYGTALFGGKDEIGEISIYIGDELVGNQKFTSFNSSFTNTYKFDDKSGTVKIMIKPTDGKIYIKSVSINLLEEPIYATSVTISGENTVPIGFSNKLTLSFEPVTTNQRNIVWSSSDENILTVAKDGTFTGIDAGSATITASVSTKESSVSNTFTVEVVKITIESLEFETSSIETYVGKSKTLSPIIAPHETSNKKVTYTSSNVAVATVDSDGNVTGQSVGECVVTCTSVDNPLISATCQVKVLEKPVLTSTKMRSTFNEFSSKTYYYIDSAPSTGTLKLLVIPVWFNDSSDYISSKENVRDDIRKAYFGNPSDTGWESVKSYYEKESNNELEITGVVSDWYECGKSLSTYNYPSGENNRTSSLASSASNWYFENNPSDSRKNYDNDKDGFIDGIVLIYGAPDYAAFKYSSTGYGFSRATYEDNLWAYTYWIQNLSFRDTKNPGPNAFIWASYDFMYSTSAASKRTGKSSYGSGTESSHSILDTHTFIHETGHVLGLRDYYDYSGKYAPAGGFSMQDFNVGGHDPFSCLALGWAKAYIPTEECEIKLEPFQSSHEVILLSPSFNGYDSPFDEYLLLELYTPTGLNKFDSDYQYSPSGPRGVNGTGIRLWHVDARLMRYTNYGAVDKESIFTSPVEKCDFIMSNTSYSSSSKDYISPWGVEYADYNLLQLLKNSRNATYESIDYFKDSNLFKNGSSFDMRTFGRQFVNYGLLNSKASLTWNFSVKIDGSNDSAIATITINKD